MARRRMAAATAAVAEGAAAQRGMEENERAVVAAEAVAGFATVGAVAVVAPQAAHATKKAHGAAALDPRGWVLDSFSSM